MNLALVFQHYHFLINSPFIMAASTRKILSIQHGPKYSYLYQVAKSGKPTFLLLHGFPSSSYDWRKQIADLGAAGYGVLAPDLLGYGETDKPNTLDAYTFSNISGHVAKILEHEKLTQVIGVGHDWYEQFCRFLHSH
jgi:soluble epoxide hydrolase/lipid-phosphate phosphatase